MNFLEFFKRLFKALTRTTDAEQAANERYVADYEAVHDLNLTAVAANNIATIVCTDATISVKGDNPRAKYLNDALQTTCISRLKNIVNRELGVGGVLLRPYVHDGVIDLDIVAQNRFIVVEQSGSMVTKAGIIAEMFMRDNKTYIRTEQHTLSPNGIYTIEQVATADDRVIPLESIEEWANIQPIITLGGVKRMLFSFVKCPVDNRKQFTNFSGVPITYGQEKLMAEIVELWNELQREYRNKAVFVGISDLLFTSKNNLPGNGIYKMFQNVGKVGDGRSSMFEVYSPDLRVQGYMDGINAKMEMLEKAIGVNKGVLTNLETKGATATEIRRSTFDTFALVDTVREGLEAAIEQLVYAMDVLANAAGLAPVGEYELAFDWSYSLLEDSAESFQQLSELQSRGMASKAELRQWVQGGTLEEAQKAIDKITEAEHSTQLLPEDEEDDDPRAGEE